MSSAASRVTTRAHDDRPSSVPTTCSAARVRVSDCRSPSVFPTACVAVTCATDPPIVAPFGNESAARRKTATRSSAVASAVDANAVVAGRARAGGASAATAPRGSDAAARSSRSRIRATAVVSAVPSVPQTVRPSRTIRARSVIRSSAC